MRKRFQLPAAVAALILVSIITVPASGQTSTVPGFTAEQAAREQRFESLIDAIPGASEDPGIIAYVRRSTHDIHLISPDGTGHRVLWTAPRPLGLLPAQDLAWRPGGCELAFSSEHEDTCSWYQSDVYAIGHNGTGYRRVTNSPACAMLAGLLKGAVEVAAFV